MYECDIKQARYTAVGNNCWVKADIVKQGATFKSTIASVEMEIFDGHSMDRDKLAERVIKVYMDSLEGE